MKKSYPFTELSTKRCRKCGRQLKRRIAEEKPSAELCFRCYKKERAKAHDRRA